MPCSTCEHWQPIEYERPGGGTLTFGPDRDPYIGECRRHAPRASNEPEAVAWPETPQDAWCGEFELDDHVKLGQPGRTHLPPLPGLRVATVPGDPTRRQRSPFRIE